MSETGGYFLGNYGSDFVADFKKSVLKQAKKIKEARRIHNKGAKMFDLATAEWLLGSINIIADTKGHIRAKIGERRKCPIFTVILDDIEKKINLILRSENG